MWEQVRKDQLPCDECPTVIAHLRQFLSKLSKPTKVAEAAWQSFMDFAKEADDNTFLDFVRRFEWSSAGPDADELTDQVRAQLRRSGAVDNSQVEEVYARLFLTVFELLTQSGLKRLSKRDLDDQLAAPTLSKTDHALLTRLNDRFPALELRVDRIESYVDDLKKRMVAVEASLDQEIWLFQIVDQRFLQEQPAPNELFLGRLPEWADVTHGSTAGTKFIERKEYEEQLYRRALEELVEPIKRGDTRLRSLFVVGEPTTGKTTLVRRVAVRLVEEGLALIADPGLDSRVPAGDPRAASHLIGPELVAFVSI